MKDIKTLYLAAKSSGNHRDISAYSEAVQELLESNPYSFLSNLEYIITSDINLPKLDKFVEAYGLAIPACDMIIESLHTSIEKCELFGKDSKAFEECLDKYESYKSNHKVCFDMYSYYSESLETIAMGSAMNIKTIAKNTNTTNELLQEIINILSRRGYTAESITDDQISKVFNDKYTEAYYSFNKNNIQGRKLAAGMINKFGEAAIPDVLITTKDFGGKGSHSLFEYLDGKYIDDHIACQWITECSNNVGINGGERYNAIPENSLVKLVEEKNDIIRDYVRESVISGNDNAVVEYTESEIANVLDLISVREYQLACAESADDAMKLQDEIYSLYESIEGIDTDFTEAKSPVKSAIDVVTTRLITLGKDLTKNLNGVIKDLRKEINSKDDRAAKKLIRFRGIKGVVGIGDRLNMFGLIVQNSTLARSKTADAIEHDTSSNSKYLKDLKYHARIEVESSTTLNGSQREEFSKIAHKAFLNSKLAEFIGAGILSIDGPREIKNPHPTKSMLTESCSPITEYTYVSYYYTFSWTLNISREYAFKDVDMSIFEFGQMQFFMNDLTEVLQESVSPYFIEDYAIPTRREYVPLSDDDRNRALNNIFLLAKDIREEFSPTFEKYPLYGLNVLLPDENKIPDWFTVNTEDQTGRRISVSGVIMHNGNPDIEVGIMIRGVDQQTFMEDLEKNHPDEVERLKAKYNIDSRYDWTKIHWDEAVAGYDKPLGQIMDEITAAIQGKFNMIRDFKYVGDNDSGPIYSGIIDNDYIFKGIDINHIQPVIEARLDNTDNKYTGRAPGYLANNHDLGYGEDQTSNSNNDMEDYRRPSAQNDRSNTPDPLYDTNDLPGDGDDQNDKQPADGVSNQAVNNYYYYTYTNSLNKNSNSFNKDNSSHDDHSIRRSVDDHSTGKRVNSDNYGPQEESSVFTFIESSTYYMDQDTYDNHVKKIWFITSSDNAQNCCVQVEGYARPMRGRSLMICLRKKDDEWQALVKRKPNGNWEFPGGGWDKGENPVDAAIRECNEETQTKVKNVKRLGTQIQYKPEKRDVSPWVKKHVEDPEDWWYGYYSAIFIGEEDGKYTGHINEEDRESTFKWKPITFIAEKFNRRLIRAIEKHIRKEFKESVDEYNESDYMSESVDVTGKRFDKAYKAAYNYDNGHMIRITYSLQGCEVTYVGQSKATRDHFASVAEEVNREHHRGLKATKNIRSFMVMMKGLMHLQKQIKARKKLLTKFLNEHIGDVGYLDFQAKNCKILEIYDLYTRKPIKDKIRIVGVYSSRRLESGKAKILTPKDLAEVHKRVEAKNSKFHVSEHKVGDIEKFKTFMSTYWNDKDDHEIRDLKMRVIDSDERDRADMELNNIPDIIGDLEMKGFHVSDEEVEAFLPKYRGDDKWIPDALPTEVKNKSIGKDSKPGKKMVTEAVGDADDMRPESDNPIRDTLQDVDRELGKTQQAAKKKVQGVVSAGSAFMKPVKRTHQWVMKLVSDWKDTRENKVKEKMADPYARKNLLSAITWCIKTGSLAKAGLLFNPFFLFLSVTKNIGKKGKMARIRHEMIGEIKKEMEIVDEKIEDARKAGDNAAKYRLMRLKNELNKKLIRVGGSDVRNWRKVL